MIPAIPEFMETDKIQLKAISECDAAFMHKLVNTADWLEFIGDRNIGDIRDAAEYIKKIQKNKDFNFWVIWPKSEFKPVGVVSLIKKEYLDHPDIGFALLPTFYQRGYAYEGADLVLRYYFSNSKVNSILATSLKHNIRSIGLLAKLGFQYQKEIMYGGYTMNVYFKNRN